MKRTELQRKAPMKRSAMKRKPQRVAKPRVSIHELWLEMEMLSARLAKAHCRRMRVCQHPDCKTPRAPWQAHHVVYEQEVRRLGEMKWNTMNVLRLCETCHARHHHPAATGDQRLPLIALRNDNFEYAFDVMGERAFDYLARRYSGHDPRLYRYLLRAERAAANS